MRYVMQYLRAARRLALLGGLAAALLVIPLLGAHQVAATDQGGDVAIQALIDMLADACSSRGGAIEVHYELDAGGNTQWVVVSCRGGTTHKIEWQCQGYPDGYYVCFFTQPTQTPQESTRPGAGNVVVAQPGENPIVTPTTPTVVVSDATAPAPITRPATTPEPTPSPTPDAGRTR